MNAFLTCVIFCCQNQPFLAEKDVSILPHSFELVYFIQIGVNHHWKFLWCNNYFSHNRSKLAKCRKSHIPQSTRATYFQISLNIIQLIDLKVLFSVFSIHINILLFSLKSYVDLMFLVCKSTLFISRKFFRFSGCNSNFWLKKLKLCNQFFSEIFSAF